MSDSAVPSPQPPPRREYGPPSQSKLAPTAMPTGTIAASSRRTKSSADTVAITGCGVGARPSIRTAVPISV
jgi:hypothetical protein